MTTTAIQRATIVASTPSSPARLHLVPVRAVLDGGWWPRSWDPVTELPGLILALDARFGPIRQVLLNGDAWDCRLRRLAVGTRVVRMGWFTSLDPALLIATTDLGDQIDLLVVPPGTAETAARAAMARAADPAGVRRRGAAHRPTRHAAGGGRLHRTDPAAGTPPTPDRPGPLPRMLPHRPAHRRRGPCHRHQPLVPLRRPGPPDRIRVRPRPTHAAAHRRHRRAQPVRHPTRRA